MRRDAFDVNIYPCGVRKTVRRKHGNIGHAAAHTFDPAVFIHARDAFILRNPLQAGIGRIAVVVGAQAAELALFNVQFIGIERKAVHRHAGNDDLHLRLCPAGRHGMNLRFAGSKAIHHAHGCDRSNFIICGGIAHILLGIVGTDDRVDLVAVAQLHLQRSGNDNHMILFSGAHGQQQKYQRKNTQRQQHKLSISGFQTRIHQLSKPGISLILHPLLYENPKTWSMFFCIRLLSNMGISCKLILLILMPKRRKRYEAPAQRR